MKRIYLLDRNIVSIIKNSVDQKPEYDNNKIRMLAKLKSKDTKNNDFSALLSILEGQKGRIENKEELKETLIYECNYLKKFFKYATTDCDYLTTNQNNTAEVFINDLENKLKLYGDFLLQVNEKILQKPKISEIFKITKEIFQIAEKLNIEKTSLAVVLSISCLCGGEYARGILKPKKNIKSHYNAFSDIMSLQRVAMIGTLAKYKNKRVKFITLDKALHKTYESTKIFGDFIDNSTTSITLTLNKNMFPRLNMEQFNDLIELFRN